MIFFHFRRRCQKKQNLEEHIPRRSSLKKMLHSKGIASKEKNVKVLKIKESMLVNIWTWRKKSFAAFWWRHCLVTIIQVVDLFIGELILWAGLRCLLGKRGLAGLRIVRGGVAAQLLFSTPPAGRLRHSLSISRAAEIFEIFQSRVANIFPTLPSDLWEL